MLVLEISLSLVKETSHMWEKPTLLTPQTNEHVHSKATEFRPYMEKRHAGPSVPM
jgi:hypothetical protein